MFLTDIYRPLQDTDPDIHRPLLALCFNENDINYKETTFIQ